MTSARPLPPPLPVGNQQTGRCEWTVKLYSAACRLPGGRYALPSRHVPAPSPFHAASVSLCSCSRSAPVQPVVAVVVVGVVRLASILSPFPPRTARRGASLPLPPSARQGHVPSPTDRWMEGEGRDLESSVCTCVVAARGREGLCRGPPGVPAAGLTGVRAVARNVLPSLSLSPCPGPPLETPQAASARDKSLQDVGVGMVLARTGQNFHPPSQCLVPGPPRKSGQAHGGPLLLWPPHGAWVLPFAALAPESGAKSGFPQDPTVLHIPSSPLEIPLDNERPR